MKYIILFFSILLTGCHTIHFDKNEQVPYVSTQNEKWHHNWAFNLYEGSSTVKPQERCQDNDWTSVKTELTFINGLAQFAGTLVGPIWYPKTTTVSCE